MTEVSADSVICGLCGEPMPPGEQMFKYHGFSGPCPKPPCNLPFERVPQHHADPGFGPVPPKPNVIPICQTPDYPSDLKPERSARQDQNRDAQARQRARRRARVVSRRLELKPEWLDELEERGYLNPFKRTIAEAEVAAVRKFLGDHLLGGKHDSAPARRD
jgi:hypothetical protein